MTTSQSKETFFIQILNDLHLEVERGSIELYTLDFPVTAPNLAL